MIEKKRKGGQSLEKWFSLGSVLATIRHLKLFQRQEGLFALMRWWIAGSLGKELFGILFDFQIYYWVLNLAFYTALICLLNLLKIQLLWRIFLLLMIMLLSLSSQYSTLFINPYLWWHWLFIMSSNESSK